MRKKKLTGKVWILGLVLLFIILWSEPFVIPASGQESALHRIQRAGTIRVGWALWYPWTYVDEKTKKITGMSPDVFEEMAKALGNVKIEWVADSWGTLSAGLQADKFDIIFPFTVTLQRAMVVGYTDYVMRESNNFLVKRKDAARFKTRDDVEQPGVKVSVTLGSNSDILVTRFFKKPEIVRLKTPQDGLMALLVGKVDAWANTGTAMVDAMKAHPDTALVKGSYAVGKNCMAVRQGDQVFLNWLNLFIAEMKETGMLEKIFNKYGTKQEIFFD